MEDRLKCFTPWDVQSKRQYSIDGVYPALNAGQGIGGQAHGVCYAFTWRGRENGCNVETQEELAYCLREPGGGGSNPMICIDKKPNVYSIDANSTDSRFRLNKPEDPFPTLTNHMSKLGVDVPMVLIDKSDRGECVVIEGNGARPSHQGPGFLESDTMYTLNTMEHHAVAYEVEAVGHDIRCTQFGRGGVL